MPRNAAGVYSLPDPAVIAGTVIDATDENDTRADVATELTNSLDRNGRGSMLASLKLYDGSLGTPGLTFGSDTDSGIYRSAANTWHMVSNGAVVGTVSPGALVIAGTLTGIVSANTFGELRYNVISPAQLVADTNDWAPAGLSTSSLIRVSTDASRNLTGLTGGAAGRRITLSNVGAQNLVLKDEDAGSVAANRFDLPGDFTLLAGRTLVLTYDGTLSRWRVAGEYVSAFIQAILDDTTLDGFLTTIGVSANLRSFVEAATYAAARTLLDVPANAEAILKTLVDAKGDLISASADNTPVRLAVGANGQTLLSDSTTTSGLRWGAPVIRDYLGGCVMSTAGGSGTMSISAGSACDSTNVDTITIAAFSKTTAAWALGSGNGGIDTGAIANNTWYAWYLIKRPDTGVVDVTFSLNGTTPALPANYTLYRRIGWGLTNGAGQWVAFTQYGDRFLWTVPVVDHASVATTTANRTARALTAAPSTEAIIAPSMNTGATGVVTRSVLITSADMTDTACTGGAIASLTVTSGEVGATATTGSPEMIVKMNSSRQVFDRADAASAVITYLTRGWLDRRGKDD